MKPDQITPYLGQFVHISFSIHSTSGVIVEMGRDFILLDTGSLIHSPSIDNITTEIPREKPRAIPLNLEDLFI